MGKITNNTLVSISLKIEDDNGNLLDESEEIIYLHGGYGQVFQKLEDMLEGKTTGNSFDIVLEPIDAFGEYEETLVVTESLENLPEDITQGMEFEDENEDTNHTTIWTVEKINDGFATLNGNHELAGISLRLYGEVLEVKQLSNKEVQEILTMEHAH